MNAGTISMPKKVFVKGEPPQLANLSSSNNSKTIQIMQTNIKTEPSEKMIQIPQSDYQYLLQTIENMQNRLIALERHCGLEGSICTSSSINQIQ